MSRSILFLAAATVLGMPSVGGRAVVRAADPIPDFGDYFRPIYHARPHEPPARILNAKKPRKKR